MSKDNLKKFIKESKDLQNDEERVKKSYTSANSLINNALPFLTKNLKLLGTIVATIVLFILYSLFAHTKEIIIVFLISGAITVLIEIKNKIKNKIKK